MRNPKISAAWMCGALLLTSCSLTEARWIDQAPTVSCKLLRRCDPITFYRDFEGLDECVEATQLPTGPGCVFDEEAARQCRKQLRWSCRKVGQRYDEVVAQCDAVWTCPDSGDTGSTMP